MQEDSEDYGVGVDNYLNRRNIPFEEKFDSDELRVIITNFLPSCFYSFLICNILLKLQNNDKENIPKISSEYFHIRNYFLIMLIIFTLFMLKGIFLFLIINANRKDNKIFKISISIFDCLLYPSYYISTFLGIQCKKILSMDFIFANFYKNIFFFYLIFVGTVYIFLFFLDLFYLFVVFLFSLARFRENSDQFLMEHGAPMHLVDRLQKLKADSQHVSDYCPICTEPISEGQNINILPCDHFFHSRCIRPWLRQNITCPMCRRRINL